mgnify:CR=1 FL=1
MDIIKTIFYGAIVVFLSPIWIPLVFLKWFNLATSTTNMGDEENG